MKNLVDYTWFLTHLSNRKSGNNCTIKHEREIMYTVTFCYSEACVLKTKEKKKEIITWENIRLKNEWKNQGEYFWLYNNTMYLHQCFNT